MSYLFTYAPLIAILAHTLLVVSLTVRVIMKRPATGVALAWLLLIMGAPYLGALLYLLIGERRIGHRRSRGLAALRIDFRQIAEAARLQGLTNVEWSKHPPGARAMDAVGRNLKMVPTVTGSNYRLHSDPSEILQQIASDIDAAEKCVMMEFYIWHPGGKADLVMEAIIRAAQRGVHCCVLIDALGARAWWNSPQPKRLRAAGIQLCQALPVGLFRTLVGRSDLRLHRKIVVIDGQLAWTGSMNLVDPRFFKQNAGVGQWIDAMVRLQGSVVAPLAATVISDWIVEKGDSLEDLLQRTQMNLAKPQGSADIQVVTSGPGESGDALLQMILALINAAKQELVLTTPYFVPDDSLLRAVRGAAARGVAVRLIVPDKVDSVLTRHASRSYFDDLLDSGVQLHLYQAGLLHTKSITVDSEMSMFGTANLDLRSIWLNYEVSLFVYDTKFSHDLRKLQQSYLEASKLLNAVEWSSRPFGQRLLEDTLRLVSPLL